MKSVATVLLMILLFVQTFSKWVWEIDYRLNQTYIANNLCMNKSKPQLHCNGKCQLAKKLAEEENSNKTSGTASLKIDVSTVLFKQEIAALDFSLNNPPLKHQAVYILKPCTLGNPAVFHPPVV